MSTRTIVGKLVGWVMSKVVQIMVLFSIYGHKPMQSSGQIYPSLTQQEEEACHTCLLQHLNLERTNHLYRSQQNPTMNGEPATRYR